MYLRHSMDEARHATAFARHAAEIRERLGLPSWGHPRTDCELLYERLGEAGFLAFVHRGEKRGRIQFEAYARYFGWRKSEKHRALFRALIEDEKEHEPARAILPDAAPPRPPRCLCSPAPHGRSRLRRAVRVRAVLSAQ